MAADESTPLLADAEIPTMTTYTEEPAVAGEVAGNDLLVSNADVSPSDPHAQFCRLVGIPITDEPQLRKHLSEATLYGRALQMRKSQTRMHAFAAALSNTLLLAQVVLGATLTALGASGSSHILITLFGVMNTIIAGLVAYLKSRGQPMRARMFRDDLEDVVDEIENSKIMWLGISEGIHGYDEIDIEDTVSVRSEIARLTRLYETAVKKYKANNPDSYNQGAGPQGPITGLHARPAGNLPPAEESQSGRGPAPLNLVAGSIDEEDESPATAKAIPKTDDKVKGKDQGTDENESPATAKAKVGADKPSVKKNTIAPTPSKDTTSKPQSTSTQQGPSSSGLPKDTTKETPKASDTTSTTTDAPK